jgi:Spy/CpxP family protein refolding chaperone
MKPTAAAAASNSAHLLCGGSSARQTPGDNSTGTGYSFQYSNSRSNEPLAALQVAPGTWWNNADTVTRLGLTKEQQLKMDDIFQKFRLTLIDLNASLSKEELIMDPLIAAERPDEVKILTQIDRIAQARAELEKANSRMLLAIRQSLTLERWTKIRLWHYRVNTRR